MYKTILIKEIRDIIGSRKFLVSFLICSLLIIISFYTGAKWYENNRSRYEAALSENIRQMSGVTDWIMVKHHVYLPPDPLAALVAGVDNDIGRDIEMFAVGELTARDSRFSDDPIFSVFHFLDIEFVFSIVLALFAILFGYNMVNGEKEAGTLRLVFANAVPRHHFILGKMTGALLAVTIPLLIPFCIGSLLLIIMGIPMDTDAWIKLGLIIVSGLLYFGVMLLLSVFLSTVTLRSSNAFLLTLIIWIFSTLIIPRAAVLIAGRLVQVPTIDELDSQKFGYRSQLWTEDMQKMNAFKVPESKNPQEMIDAFHKYMGELGRQRNEKMDLFNQRLNEERRNRQNNQEALAFSLARIVPSANFSLAVMRLAGSSLELKQAFLSTAQSYQQSYAQFLGSKTDGILPGSGMVFRMINDDGQEPVPINPHEIPAFVYKNKSSGQVLQLAGMDILMLIGFGLLFFCGAWGAFLRYDLR
jgi:ABC-type transport system involved in multi-copper enzyme maturation permease subunit